MFVFLTNGFVHTTMFDFFFLLLTHSLTAPSQPPSAIAVVAMNSTSIRVSWAPPLLMSRNGIIQGYKIIYNIKDGISGVVRVIQGNTTHEQIISGLRKYTEYSVKLLAFTVGDGPLSSPYLVTTEQDGKYTVALNGRS